MLRDCNRYAMKRKVAVGIRVFSWSMSDFKPGDQRRTQEKVLMQYPHDYGRGCDCEDRTFFKTPVRKTSKFFGFFVGEPMKHTGVCCNI